MGIDAGVGEDAGTYHCRSAYETDKNTKRGKGEKKMDKKQRLEQIKNEIKKNYGYTFGRAEMYGGSDSRSL